ncbi:hypothetical protein QVD17_41672 [Tagetes erecta]|uniref:Homeobox-leucine zipper protein n=1 Tax=Tagetes erecta TaxID=13708 RepID=A0AAD8JN41_TARER|nr:hypothetical protein QVD17_41672 [Tagetes erecta]
MEWSSSNPIPFIPQPEQSSFAFNLYNYNIDPYGETEMKHEMMQQASLPMTEFDYDNNISQDRKKKMSSEQLEALENSFQMEMKLDPDRKMKLAQQLGVQPRQIAVWFQNRRARWKAKQLERLYDALKQEFDVVFREKQKLQDEVLALRSLLREHDSKRQATMDMSGEDTVESTSMAAFYNQAVVGFDCNYMLSSCEGAATHSAYWAVFPSYP